MSVEAGNFERFGDIFAKEPRLKIPEVYWELSTRRSPYDGAHKRNADG